MKITYDRNQDALHTTFLENPTADRREIAPGYLVSFDSKGNVTGIDIDHARSRVDLPRAVFQRSKRSGATLISPRKLPGLKETAHLLRSAANARRLLDALAQALGTEDWARQPR